MKKRFRKYLIDEGYSEYTPSGNPSTVYNYPNRVNTICKWEKIDWETLSQKIDIILPQYKAGGVKEELGKKSHNAFISALKRFEEFNDSEK